MEIFLLLFAALLIASALLLGWVMMECYRAEIKMKRLLNGCPFHAPVLGMVFPRHGRKHPGCYVCDGAS